MENILDEPSFIRRLAGHEADREFLVAGRLRRQFNPAWDDLHVRHAVVSFDMIGDLPAAAYNCFNSECCERLLTLEPKMYVEMILAKAYERGAAFAQLLKLFPPPFRYDADVGLARGEIASEQCRHRQIIEVIITEQIRHHARIKPTLGQRLDMPPDLKRTAKRPLKRSQNVSNASGHPRCLGVRRAFSKLRSLMGSTLRLSLDPSSYAWVRRRPALPRSASRRSAPSGRPRC